VEMKNSVSVGKVYMCKVATQKIASAHACVNDPNKAKVN
jgi:hypothetical protein